jgi:NRAMP (natural resistance-associated macrophage protein)-like metal ion transporter
MAEGNPRDLHEPARPDPDAAIRGALGTIHEGDQNGRRSLRRRLLTLLAVVGPGLIVMVGDNDAGGVSTYAQAGQNYGLTLLWTLPLIIPVLIVNQEMVVRLGAVTGVGYARLISERFGKFWARFSVSGLFVLNFLTIATEFAGITLALSYFGVSEYVCVPIAAAALIAMTASGSFRRWERFMFIFVVANFLVIPLVVFAHPHAGPILHGFSHTAVFGGINSTSVLFIIAVVGTTVAPWQLFFQQSNIVDKRITPRWINYERADTILGSGVTVLAATLIISTTAFAFMGHHSLFGHFKNGATVAKGLDQTLGNGAGALFAIVLLNASIIGAAAVTLTTTYAVGDLFGLRSSLDRSFGEAKQFYAVFGLLVAVAAGIVLIPHAPLGLFVLAVQAFAGILLPSTTIFALLLCNDREVLGPWVNRAWLNVLAGLVITVLLGLSMVLMVTTVFASVPTSVLAVILAVFFVAGIVVGVVLARQTLREERENPVPSNRAERAHWQMPSAALLRPMMLSRGRRLVLRGLMGYLVVSIGLLLAKSIELGLGHK